jgi:hypothetical protein
MLRVWALLTGLLPIALMAWFMAGDPYANGLLPARGFVWWASLAEVLAWAVATVCLLVRSISIHRHVGWRCAKCGYDRRGVDRTGPCPECGAAGDAKPAMPLRVRHTRDRAE